MVAIGAWPWPVRRDRGRPLDDVEQARQSGSLRYGEDDHYDLISAFIKAIRGSDPTPASTGWLACSGRGGRPVHRPPPCHPGLRGHGHGRLDGLVVADAAARAVEFVGLPEAGLNLAHAVVYLATAPKSNTMMSGFPAPSRTCSIGPAARSRVPALDPSVSTQQDQGGRRVRLPPQRPVRLRSPGIPPAGGRGPGLLPTLAARGGGGDRAPVWRSVWRCRLRLGGVVAIREVPGSVPLTTSGQKPSNRRNQRNAKLAKPARTGQAIRPVHRVVLASTGGPPGQNLQPGRRDQPGYAASGIYGRQKIARTDQDQARRGEPDEGPASVVVKQIHAARQHRLLRHLATATASFVDRSA